MNWRARSTAICAERPVSRTGLDGDRDLPRWGTSRPPPSPPQLLLAQSRSETGRLLAVPAIPVILIQASRSASGARSDGRFGEHARADWGARRGPAGPAGGCPWMILVKARTT